MSKHIDFDNMAPVIVFGPTGNIGSIVARTAGQQGADVALAMRDVNKTIPGLSKSDEEAGSYTRVPADLSDPKRVESAVKTSGAKRAFVYMAQGTSDHMKSTFEAMKAGGVDFVVFLSSYTIGERAPESVPPSELIAFVHAQAEASLHAVFGAENFVAIRPGGFVTNLLRYKQGIASGEVRLFGEYFEMDWITTGDMGRVAGTVLVSGPKNGQQQVFLYGPQVIPQGDALVKVGKALGKDVKITGVDEEEGRQIWQGLGIPKPFIEYLLRSTVASQTMDRAARFARYEEGVENVKLYTGKSSTSLDEWLQENKEMFIE